MVGIVFFDMTAIPLCLRFGAMETYRRESDSPAWLFCVHASFGVACLSGVLGIGYLPVDWWVRGYMGMSFLFTIGSTLSLAKTLRDQHEAKKLVKKIDDFQTEKILREHVFESGAVVRS